MKSILPQRLNRYPTRDIRIDGEVAYVPLTRGFVAIIDAETVPLVAGRNWFAAPDKAGRICAATSFKRGGKTYTYYLHRVVMGEEGDALIDHKDGNALDNRRDNLRPATFSQNTANRHAPTESNSGFKGVWFDKRKEKFVASIGVKRKRITLGRFDRAIDAALAYDAAAVSAFGDFARTNERIGRI